MSGGPHRERLPLVGGDGDTMVRGYVHLLSRRKDAVHEPCEGRPEVAGPESDPAVDRDEQAARGPCEDLAALGEHGEHGWHVLENERPRLAAVGEEQALVGAPVEAVVRGIAEEDLGSAAGTGKDEPRGNR